MTKTFDIWNGKVEKENHDLASLSCNCDPDYTCSEKTKHCVVHLEKGGQPELVHAMVPDLSLPSRKSCRPYREQLDYLKNIHNNKLSNTVFKSVLWTFLPLQTHAKGLEDLMLLVGLVRVSQESRKNSTDHRLFISCAFSKWSSFVKCQHCADFVADSYLSTGSPRWCYA